MTLDYDPIPVLQSVGYTEREAVFLYTVALHSGYFLRRQYLRFIRRGRGALAEQFLRRARMLGHLQSIACGQARFVYHLTSVDVYTAVGLAASHHRRLKGDAHIKSRLMVLDFVLDHLDDVILDTGESKVHYFTQSFGLPESLFPQSRGVAFAEELPILVSQQQDVLFTFFDEGVLSPSGFENFLLRYRAVFAALSGFELLYLSDSTQNFEHMSRIFASRFPEAKALGVTTMTPRGVDHFLEYLCARAHADAQKPSLTLRDLAVLHEGESMYTTLEHQALVSAWQIGSASVERIRQRFQQQGPRATFTTVLLPYRYPLHHFRRERANVSDLGSSDGSSRRLLFELEAIRKQPLRGGDK
ncbi:hypothetical protein [Granulicella sp. S156]|uniref:hypothetical protein n=1 Tax=Granulicella sp. S156 TaxID=1747224 RepID=UPI00131D7A5B|nr:hypothetical protein [Granulicella sp. S156]